MVNSVSYRNFLYPYEQSIVIARSVGTKQSYKKSLLIRLKTLAHEIAAPFGLAMTVILGALVYGTRQLLVNADTLFT